MKKPSEKNTCLKELYKEYHLQSGIEKRREFGTDQGKTK